MASSMPQNTWPSSTSFGSIVSRPGARETSSKPYVGRRRSTFELNAGIVDAFVDGFVGAVPCSIKRRSSSLPVRWLRSLARAIRLVGDALAVQPEAEPRGALGLLEVVADAIDGVPVGRPDDLAPGVLERQPAEGRVLVRKDGIEAVANADREHRGDSMTASTLGSWNVLTRSRSKNASIAVRPEARLLPDLAEGGERHPLARLDRPGDALPQPRQDAPGSAADQQDLERRGPQRSERSSNRRGRVGAGSRAEYAGRPARRLRASWPGMTQHPRRPTRRPTVAGR